VNSTPPAVQIDHCACAAIRAAIALHMLAAAVTDTSITRTLARALRALGSRERLAAYLGVPEAELAEWLAGRGEPPTAIYVRALDLVARGPFVPRNKAR
jgi:hypothetical protein